MRFRGFGDVTDYAFLSREKAIFTGNLTIIYPNGGRRSVTPSQVISENGLKYFILGKLKTLLIPEGVNPQDFAARVSAKTPTSALPASLLTAATSGGLVKTSLPTSALPTTTLPSTELPAASLAPPLVVVTMKPPPPPPVVVNDTTYVAVSNSAPRVTPTIVPDLIAVNTLEPEAPAARKADPAQRQAESQAMVMEQATATAVPAAREVAPAATPAAVPAAQEMVDVQTTPVQEAGVAPVMPPLSMKWIVIGVAGIAAWVYLGPAITKALSASPRRSYGRERDE